jgi:hypothetical protein
VLTCYRPISLLPIVSNISEKLLLKRFLKMVENNGFIPDHQFGFREALHNRTNTSNCTKDKRRLNESQSVHVTFTTRRETFPPVHMNSLHLPQQKDVKYLGLRLDRRLT